MTTKNPQAFSREDYILFFLWRRGREERFDLYYFFSIKENVKDIFIEGLKRKEQQKEKFFEIHWKY